MCWSFFIIFFFFYESFGSWVGTCSVPWPCEYGDPAALWPHDPPPRDLPWPWLRLKQNGGRLWSRYSQTRSARSSWCWLGGWHSLPAMVPFSPRRGAILTPPWCHTLPTPSQPSLTFVILPNLTWPTLNFLNLTKPILNLSLTFPNPS